MNEQESSLAARMRHENEQGAGPLTERIERLERVVFAMAWWLVDAQSGFAKRDAEAIGEILRGQRDD